MLLITASIPEAKPDRIREEKEFTIKSEQFLASLSVIEITSTKIIRKNTIFKNKN